MPEFDVATGHSIEIDADVPAVWRALLEIDFSSHPVTRALMTLRSVPSMVIAPLRTWRRLTATNRRSSGGLKTMLRDDFALLEEREPHEIVRGRTGRFWSPTGGLVRTEPSTFRDPVPEGLARAAWGFGITSGEGRTLLATQTRVLCGGDAARESFLRYWKVVGPFSGIIRGAVLRQVRSRARASDEARR